MTIPKKQEFTVEYANNNLNQVIEYAKQEAVILTQNEQKFFLVNEDVLESWLETIALLKDKQILEDIEQARNEYNQGETLSMDDVFG